MIHDRKIVDQLGRIQPKFWEGIVFRHMFSGFPPERENTSGARWNPPQTPAIYTSLSRLTAIAEADYYISMQPLLPKAPRLIYRISVRLNSVLDLSDWTALEELGLQREGFRSIDYSQSQKIGGAVDWLGQDGLLVPSARAHGTNLIIFPNRRKSDHRFEVLDFEELPN